MSAPARRPPPAVRVGRRPRCRVSARSTGSRPDQRSIVDAAAHREDGRRSACWPAAPLRTTAGSRSRTRCGRPRHPAMPVNRTRGRRRWTGRGHRRRRTRRRRRRSGRPAWLEPDRRPDTHRRRCAVPALVRRPAIRRSRAGPGRPWSVRPDPALHPDPLVPCRRSETSWYSRANSAAACHSGRLRRRPSSASRPTLIPRSAVRSIRSRSSAANDGEPRRASDRFRPTAAATFLLAGQEFAHHQVGLARTQ